MAPATALLAGALLLTGCAGAVQVGAPDEADSAACAQVDWPEEVSGHAQVPTSPEVSWAAAWGDPAIIARCGIPALQPTGFDCVGVDGIDWIVRDLEDGAAMSTYGTDPAIEVLVPAEYGPGPLLLPAFTAAASALPQTELHCD